MLYPIELWVHPRAQKITSRIGCSQVVSGQQSCGRADRRPGGPRGPQSHLCLAARLCFNPVKDWPIVIQEMKTNCISLPRWLMLSLPLCLTLFFLNLAPCGVLAEDAKEKSNPGA